MTEADWICALQTTCCNLGAVDHACHRCDARITEGTPFCPQCGAPQIRVSSSGPESSATAPLSPGTPGDLQPPSQPVFPRHYPDAAAPGDVRWRQALPLALTAGAASALLSFIPYLFFVWAALAGMWAVSRYRDRVPLAPPTTGAGARLGAVVGLIGGLIYGSLFTAMLLLVQGFRSSFLQEMERRAGGQPEAQEVLRLMSSPEGFATLITGMMALLLAIFIASAALGGALAARSKN